MLIFLNLAFNIKQKNPQKRVLTRNVEKINLVDRLQVESLVAHLFVQSS